jgi:hypothetical protein
MSSSLFAQRGGPVSRPPEIAAGDWLRSLGVESFVVAAMRYHGGATAKGQVQLLADLGMTEQTLGMPIRATMETVELDRLPAPGESRGACSSRWRATTAPGPPPRR